MSEKYEWLDFPSDLGEYAKLPAGVATAWDDPEIRAAEYEPDHRPPYDSGDFNLIETTLDPGNHVGMCVSDDNNKNLTRCEYNAVADEGRYSVLHLHADVDASNEERLGGFTTVITSSPHWLAWLLRLYDMVKA